VYELIDAIDSADDLELLEELGDLLLQVVFHCQLAQERGAFDFQRVCRTLVEKLVRRHPHVFGKTKVKDVDQVWANWERIKRAEKKGTKHERPSVFDGIPKHLPALQRAEKLVKKARKAGLLKDEIVLTKPFRMVGGKPSVQRPDKSTIAKVLFDLAAYCQSKGWSAEEVLRTEIRQREKAWRKRETPSPAQNA